MKRVLMITAILILGLSGVFAEGQSEAGDVERGWRYDERPALEEISLTGEIYFEGLDFPVLKTADEEYALMVPRFYDYEVSVEEGQTITVEGLLGPEDGSRGRFARADENTLHVMVQSAIIDGEEFKVENPMQMGRGMDRGRFDDRRMGPETRRGGSQRAPSNGGRW